MRTVAFLAAIPLLAGCKELVRLGERASASDHLIVVDREISSTRATHTLKSITIQNKSQTLIYRDIEMQLFDASTQQEVFRETLVDPIQPGEVKVYTLNIRFAGTANPEVRWLRAQYDQVPSKQR
jgi:hypothetical protein